MLGFACFDIVHLLGCADCWETRLLMGRGGSSSPQMKIEEFARSPVGQLRRGGVVVGAVVPRERVALAGISVDRNVGLGCERCLDLGLCSLVDELVLFTQMHQQGSIEPTYLAEVFFSIPAMIGNSG